MEDYRWNYHVPAFGSWDYGDDNMPYTQCFETARTQQQQQQGGSYGRYGGYTEVANVEERDLYSYVTGDLYQHDFVTPAVIVVPRPRRKGESGYTNVKGVKKQQQVRQKQEWNGYSYDIKEPPSPIISPPKAKPTILKSKSKAIDEDLYKIPPEYLHVKPKRKKGFGLFSSCLLPACA